MPSIASWGRFARNKRGNVALLFGLSVIPIALAVGVAVDYGRALAVRERMADAADASALAVGSWTGLTEAQLKTKAQQYFDANYSASSIGTPSAIKVTFPGDDIVVQVSGTVPTTFMKLANFNSIDVGASSTVTKRQRNIELALVLDTTGSMGQRGKMSAMKDAAKLMVRNLFQEKSTSDTLRIAVVPFSGAVNIGKSNENSGWLDKSKCSGSNCSNMSTIAKEDHEFKNGENAWELMDDLKNTSWNGCVRERGGSYELSDDAPNQSVKNSLFAPYFAPDEPDWGEHSDWNWYSNNYINDGDCGTSQEWKRTPEQCQAYTGKYKNAWPSNDGASYNCPPNPIQPLTNDQKQVIDSIDALQPKGNTVIPAGLLWGWRVLSPGEPFTEGKGRDDEERVRAIVLLTDGENMVSGGGNGKNKSVYNAFGYAAEGHLGNTNGSNAESTLNSKLTTVCNKIDAEGILIYTITFQVNDTATKNLMRNCATEPDEMYKNSPSNDELAGILNDFAQGLSELRIAY